MKSVKSIGIVLGIVSLIFLGACSSNQATNPENSPTTNTNPASSAAPSDNGATTEPSNQVVEAKKGGQVVEAGAYHLEFVPEKESNGTHLDFYLQKGDNHQAVPDAKVTAQVQSPDGTQKTLDLTYDASGKHYTALLPSTAAGSYQVKMTSNVNGEKVDGRFSFNQ